ncbi:hypothetical protein PsorP6_010815 [Peronosclerospora sorghi]|uniref:Uncharacterized protein n=1 Tax=Peronosclerospora sorghi TaxID=230839 RepID=A0ACC0VWB1_9STRA|nr:hypothetical protein PsorP6_010815 [Peronosclerospora sorghi]
MFPAEDRQQAALNSAISELFLMIFAPGIYFDPVKIQALLPDCLPPKRVRLSPFLTWGDVNLLCITKSDAVQIFTSDPRTPPHVIAALTHLVTIELPEAIETGLSRLYDSLQSNEHFIYSDDSGARCFWSHTTSPVLDERRGVALLLSSASPFGEVEDLTADVYTEQLRNRYLLLKTCLGDQAVFIHVVYAPDEPSRREEFFHSLPVNFDHTRSDRTSQDEGSFHIVLGDFNVTLDSYLDQATPSHHLPAQGRPVLRNWLDALGLIDAWRFQHPDVREFTSPTRKNRLDYCF